MTRSHCSSDPPHSQSFYTLFDNHTYLNTYAESVGYFLNRSSCSFVIDAGYKKGLASVKP